MLPIYSMTLGFLKYYLGKVKNKKIILIITRTYSMEVSRTFSPFYIITTEPWFLADHSCREKTLCCSLCYSWRWYKPCSSTEIKAGVSVGNVWGKSWNLAVLGLSKILLSPFAASCSPVEVMDSLEAIFLVPGGEDHTQKWQKTLGNYPCTVCL